MLQKLERDISGTNYELFSKQKFNVSRYHNANSLTIYEQETLKIEEDMWKFVTEWVNADYIYLQSKEESMQGKQRTPMTLISDIIKSNHEYLSCHSILKWLEKIYRQNTFMSNLLKLEFEDVYNRDPNCDEMDLENYRKFLDMADKNADDKTSKFLYEAMRRGKLELAKKNLIDVNQAWKTWMLNGSIPWFDQVIDDSLQHAYWYLTTHSEANSLVQRSSSQKWDGYFEIDKKW